MATNRKAVLTDVKKQLVTSFVDINKTVALISDTTTITDLKKLYTTLEEVEVDFLTTSPFYAMAKAYFDEGATQLYAVPVDGESSGTYTSIAIEVTDFTSISDGTFDITIDSVVESALAMDFTSDTSVAEIAATIDAVTTPLGASASVGIGNSIVLTSLTTGLTSNVTTMAVEGTGTDLSVLLAEFAVTTGDKDITGKLTELENDATPGFNFVTVGMDKALGITKQIDEAVLTQFAFEKEYDIIIDTSEAAVITDVTTDIVSVNKAFYDNLSGDDKLRVGNVSFIYTDDITDFVSFGVMGKLMSKDIGTQTVKFMKPKNSDAVSMTNAELTLLLNKNGNVYTGTNERIGKSFVKEGTTLKDGDFIDTSLGSIWIKVQLDEAIYNLLTTVKVPVNLDGFTLLENITSPVFDLGIDQGIVDDNASGIFETESGREINITDGYGMVFFAGTLPREIIGEYGYVEEIAGHFITNRVTIVSELGA